MWFSYIASYRITSYFPRCKFPEWLVLSFSRNLKIHDPKNQKTHMSDMQFTQSLHAYMSVWTPVIDEMYACLLQTRTISTIVCSSYMHTKNIVLCGQTFSLHRVFIACSISTSAQPPELL